MRRNSLSAWVFIAALTASCTSNSAKSRYLLAEKLWTDGKYNASVNEFERVTAKDPKGKLGLQAQFRAGMTQTLYLYQHEQAIQKFRAFIEVSGDTPTAWEAQKQIGEILFVRTEQYEQATIHYQSLVKLRPDASEVPEFLYRIAKSRFYLWNFEEAVSSFQDLQRRFPNLIWGEKASYEIGVTFFTRGEQRPNHKASTSEAYQEAIDAYQRFLKQYPTSDFVPYARFGIASCFEEMDQLDAAYHQYEALLPTYPSPKVIRIKLIRIRERQKQKSR